MPLSEFSEKAYEVACAVELGGEHGTVLSPSQVLEKALGYDAATNPAAANAVWTALGLPRPSGVTLLPTHWPTAPPPGHLLPAAPVSLILQYKRPYFVTAHRTPQWLLWNAPYFSFRRSQPQHQVLLSLQRRLLGQAIVRYASPAFWTQGELEAAHSARSVLQKSGFVGPASFGRHQTWTYQVPGSYGRPNPSGQPVYWRFADERGVRVLGA